MRFSNDQTRQRNAGFLAMVLSLVIVTLGGSALFAYQYIIGQKPSVQYMRMEAKTFKEVFDYNLKNEVTLLKERMKEQAHQTSWVFKGDVALDEESQSQFPDYGLIKSLLFASTFETEQLFNPDDQETMINIGLLLQGANIMDMSIYQNKEISALKIPMMYDKYFILENDQLDKLWEGEIGYQEITEMPNLVELQQTQLSWSEWGQVAEDYLEIVASHLTDDHFTFNPEKEFEGNTYESVEITLTEEETKQILTDLAEHAKKDERLLISLTTFPDEEKYIKEFFEAVISDVENLDMPDGVQYTAYIKDDWVELRSFRLPELEVLIGTEKLEDDGYRFKVVFMGFFDNLAQRLSYTEDRYKLEEGYKVKRQVTYTDLNAEREQYSFQAETMYLDDETNTDFYLVIESEDLGDSPNISGYYNQTVDVDHDQANRNVELGFNLSFIDGLGLERYADISIEGENEITFTDDLDMPELKDRETVDLLDISPEEEMKIMTEISRNIEKYYESLFDGFGF
ncbi:hypothetical protein EDD68_12517 [Melghiribacillus thermohalophilus]|uniref:Uncharacterized protein n=1 Tax=Melghiribacillus thermohalophilus TaxID=1324956 RepID=A0A4R3MT60_9BACI|nr:DUF6583 family protein [Melghiribacillus thermohalophilus]TCT18006.1 hypothetical protein EDD68_12517 [Melghiribacillus thermohalophilus]